MRDKTETLPERIQRVIHDKGVRYFVREGFWFGLERSVEKFYRLNGDWENGTSVWEQEWDCYIVLDACRFDLMKEVLSQDMERENSRWPQLHELDSMWSLGSSSDEWMQRNFRDIYSEQMSETTHITGNLFSQDLLNTEDWAFLDEVWEYGWDSKFGTTPADVITDRAIEVGRNHTCEDMIVHYMQPHHPFVESKFEQTSKSLDDAVDTWNKYDTEKTIWNQLRDGTVSRNAVWSAYKDTLEYVLDEVVRLLNNLDADRVLITADHGNALGECGVWGHPSGVAINALRTVPLITTSATDSGESVPERPPEMQEIDTDEVNERLQSLGYMS